MLDLADPDLYTGPDRFRMWRELIDADTAVWTGPGGSPSGFWSVFGHRDCARVLSPRAPFTSEHGMMIGFDADHSDVSGGRMLVVTDGAAHTALRGLIGPFLSRIRAPELGSLVDREVEEIADRMRSAEPIDVATTVGPRLPAAVVCEVIGVPAEDREHLIELTNHAFGGEESTFDRMTPAEAHTEILFYFNDLVDDRSSRPQADLISAMLADGRLSPEDAVINCDNVLIGGNETTRHAIAGTFHALHTGPGLLDALREDPGLVDGAVEEVIRWTSPAMHVLRVATEDVTVGGRQVRAGQPVVAWLAAANRDPRVFPDPGALRLDRGPARHLGFGTGPHHCLGAVLARLELRALLSRLAEQAGAIDLAGPPGWLRSNLVQGYRSLAVSVQWR